MRERHVALVLILVAVVATPAAFGDDETASLEDQLLTGLKKPYFNLLFVLQVVADYQSERTMPGENGFSIPNLRIGAFGELDGGFGYFFLANIADSPSVLDGFVTWKATPELGLTAGVFKTPFSAELLIPAQSIDFVNRSQAVTALAPGREIGLQASGRLAGDRIGLALGVFNGNGFQKAGNDSENLLIAGRAAWYPLSGARRYPFGTAVIGPGGNTLEVAVSAAVTEDENLNRGGGFFRGFEGRRELAGVDFRWVHDRFLLAGEAIAGRVEPADGRRQEPFGYHLTAGYMVGPRSQVLLRWDSFRPDGVNADSDLAIIGYNFWPTKLTEIQINYVAPTEDGFESHQLLVNLQVSF